VQDARALKVDGRFDAVLSTFDSLNHILTLQDLRRVFSGVRDALRPGGLFVFDMNLEQAYSVDLRQWTVHIADDNVGLVRGTYDFVTKLASTELIWFIRKSASLWRQSRSVVEQRCYPQPEIVLALEATGFGAIEVIPASEARITTDLGFGRVFFVARSQE
jgi:SAM-dependent methyltransferase